MREPGGGGVVGLVERLRALGDGGDQFLRVGEAAMLALLLLPALRLEAEGLELANLVGEERALARRGDLRALARRADFGGLAPLAETGGDLARGGLGTGERIEEGALAVAPHELLVLVLAVDVHEHLAHLAQLRRGRGPSVHERARAARRVDRAAKHARLVGLVEFLLREPAFRRARRGEVEFRADIRARGPGAPGGP